MTSPPHEEMVANNMPSQRSRCAAFQAFWRRCCSRQISGTAATVSPDLESSRDFDERRPSQMDPRSLDTDTDRLLAGVARLIFRHVQEGEASSGTAAVAGPRKPATPLGRIPSGRLRQGCAPLTAADFDEELFVEPTRCRRRFACWPCLRKPALVEQIYSLLKSVAALSEFKKEIAVLAAIYVERLLTRHPALHLANSNWRPLLIASLHLASKTWEDVHAWNAEFTAYLRCALGLRYSARCLHRLELQVLTGLEYHMEVCGELYAAYYFALMEADAPPTPPVVVPQDVTDVGPRATSYAVEATAALLSDRSIGEMSNPPTPSSSSSAGRELANRAHQANSANGQSWNSITTSATSRSSMFGLNRAASSNACCQASASDFSALSATFCGVLQDDRFWQLRSLQMPRLEPSNPHVGYFRHAPRALPPSPHIPCRGSVGQAKSVFGESMRGRHSGRQVHLQSAERRLASL
eukprot:TRINITY_DN78594_c0_g1_i1.p1 TRINITY_DN78594_c0_g1~~TRINITY_DN78594_c0_g1_i1.p1  ORF type:complete len:467 (+),score=69.91 TRINITY_DN78594_c0_g1_i1:35-1435(+)